MTRSTDFVIIGAGSAGCVVARVLAERGFQVLLVEAGPDASVCRTPALYLNAFGSADDWAFETVPQPKLADRVIRWPSGRGPGGSTRINAMIWYAPLTRDLQSLALAGGPEWSVDLLTQSLDRISHWVQPEHARWISDAAKQFLIAAAQQGFAFGPFVRMARHGHRRTSADLLAESPATQRVQTIIATVERVTIKDSRATGVELLFPGSRQTETMHANNAVILSGGAIASPLLLMKSGVGPADCVLTQTAGTEPFYVSEQVGRNLSDHLVMPLVYATAPHLRFPSYHDTRALARFQVLATGPLASNLAEAGGVFPLPSVECQPAAQTQIPNSDQLSPSARGCEWAQIHVTPTHYLLYPHPRAPAAMTLGVNLCHPKSRGRIRRHGARPGMVKSISIDPAYLSAEDDLSSLLDAIRTVRDLSRRTTPTSFHRGELIPGDKRDSDEALTRAIARYAQTLYHPTGTCRMGLDAAAVVDHELAVRGIRGLHVVDASVLPTTPSVNPNSLVMTLAMHAANRIADLSL